MDAGQERLPDVEAIRGQMTGWIHRDRGNWAELLELFHPDGTIEVTWFSGLARDFVEGSRRMGESAFRAKHLISDPVIAFTGDRAVVETNAVIAVETPTSISAPARTTASSIRWNAGATSDASRVGTRFTTFPRSRSRTVPSALIPRAKSCCFNSPPSAFEAHRRKTYLAYKFSVSLVATMRDHLDQSSRSASLRQ